MTRDAQAIYPISTQIRSADNQSELVDFVVVLIKPSLGGSHLQTSRVCVIIQCQVSPRL